MTPSLYEQSRGRVLAVFGATADRVVERNYYVQQAQAPRWTAFI